MREVLILLSAVLQHTLAHVIVSIPQKEHKIHNIVLYPDKHSWCKTTPIKQVITHPGCKSVEIDNNVCVGACFSYSIPNTEPQTPGDVQPYCDSCQPLQIKWKQITLECPDSDYGEDNITLKRVEMINTCACASCKDLNSRSHGIDSSSIQPDLDEPELMSLMMEMQNTREKEAREDNEGENPKDTVTALPEAVTEIITEGVATSLKKMDDGEALLDLEALKEIRTKIEQENHKIDDDLSLSSFMDKMKSEQNVRVLDSADSKATDGVNNHQRHHRVLGPHHSLVYPKYSLDIAAELYEQEQLKSKPTLEATSTMASHHHQDNDVALGHISSEDNMIFVSREEKINLKRKKETNGDEQLR